MDEPAADRARRFEAHLAVLLPLRYRAFVVVVLVTLAPVAFVLLSNYYEGTLRHRLLAQTQQVAAQAARQSPRAPAADRVRALADSAGARVRLLSLDLRVIAEHDQSSTEGIWQPVAALFARSDGPHPLQQLDAELGPLAQRSEFAMATRSGRARGCTVMDHQRVLRCFTLQRLPSDHLVYVEMARHRGARALYEQRYQVLKVALFVLPGALLLAAWLSWRMIRPIERLRSEIQRRARHALPRDDLPVERLDEFGELATAFNDLLARLRKRTQANEAFVADLAHEFKNPVAAIRAAAERLEQGGLDAGRTARIARALNQSSRQLHTLLSEFLELASADAGMRGEPRRPMRLAPMVQSLVEQLRADERFQGSRFTTETLADDTAPLVERRVCSAVRNLLENAATFAGEGGQVQVRLERVDRYLRLQVQDSGPGIAPEDLPRVFDRFFSRRQGGTGLGLAMVRAVVEAHDGWVEAHSRPGQGATFGLYFPTDRP